MTLLFALAVGLLLLIGAAGVVRPRRHSPRLARFDVPPPVISTAPVSMELCAPTTSGRHARRDVPGELTATSILRAVKAEEAALPDLPHPTRRQLKEAGA